MKTMYLCKERLAKVLICEACVVKNGKFEEKR